MRRLEEFPGSPVVKSQAFTDKGLGLVPGQGTKVPQATRHDQKINKTF